MPIFFNYQYETQDIQDDENRALEPDDIPIEI